MPASIIIGTMLFIFIVGSLIAVAWWRLAGRAAPYEDEIARDKTKTESQRPRDVIVVPSKKNDAGGTQV